MSTDTSSLDLEVCAFVLAAVEYLDRNDFTSISQIGLRLIRAKDGSRGVFVWMDSTSADHAIPMKLIEMARKNRCRIDIISVERTNDGTPVMKHLMNAVETG